MTSIRIRLTSAVPVLMAAASLLLSPTIGSAHADVTQPRGPVGGPLLGSTGVVTDAAQEPATLPSVSAKSFLIADLTTGDVLAAKNPHGRFRPASAIKVLTAVTLLPRLDPALVYKASFADANVEGSKVGIVPNGTYSVHNLFEGMFLTSGNDASAALASAAGGLAPTVSLMNAKAKELGAFDTTARNSSGLDAPGQYSSAYDLAVIARAGMERADFRAYARTVRSTFPGKPTAGGGPRKSFEIYTQNKLVLNYPGAIGIKTGWTTQARGTFIGAATRNGRTLLVTVMHTGQGAWREAGALLDWGFAHAAAKPVGTLNAISRTTAAAPKPKTSELSSAKADPGNGSLLRWLGWGLLLLAAAVVGLRARVLIKRALRRRRRLMAGALVARAYLDGLPLDRLPPMPRAEPDLSNRGLLVDDGTSRVGRSA